MTENQHTSHEQTTDDEATDSDTDGVPVGEEVELISFEARDGYGRVVIERTPDGESDNLKLQAFDSDAENSHRDIDTLAEVGRWFSNEGSWEDLHGDL